MSRTRSGRKSWETRVEYDRQIGGIVEGFAKATWQYDAAQTKAMVILRITTGGRKEVITFSHAYGELSQWEGRGNNRAFSNISEDGLSDMLVDTFQSGASVFTTKAEYKLWNPVH